MPRRNTPAKNRRPQRGLGDKRGRHKKATSQGLSAKVRYLSERDWWKPGEAA